jgi:lipopolysaccharide export system permease protein
MKKLDKLIIQSFLGPFILTFLVVVFILLTQFLLKYLDDFVGKDLGFNVFATLIGYFSINMVPVALPLAILLSSLMTFGNLGQHHELTAIKGSGISLIRVLIPISLLVVILTFASLMFNNYIVPKANLRAWSLLYDIRQKRPTLEFKEGTFYNGLPNYSIKINKKYPENDSLLGDIMIYDHTRGRGNTDVILADSGKMYSINNDRYLVIELFNGNSYSEYDSERGRQGQQYVRNEFKESRIVFNLSSFDFARTKEELFATNKIMRNINELKSDIDSLERSKKMTLSTVPENVKSYYQYHLRQEAMYADTAVAMTPDSLATWASLKVAGMDEAKKREIASRAANQARNLRSFTKSYEERVSHLARESNMFTVEMYKKYTQAVACFVLFLIGAPLGAIIKKGGLGVPVIISIIFFILFYVISMTGEKWAKEGVVYIPYGMWTANGILFIIGLFFLGKARNDSSLLDADYYINGTKRFFRKFKSKKKESELVEA